MWVSRSIYSSLPLTLTSRIVSTRSQCLCCIQNQSCMGCAVAAVFYIVVRGRSSSAKKTCHRSLENPEPSLLFDDDSCNENYEQWELASCFNFYRDRGQYLPEDFWLLSSSEWVFRYLLDIRWFAGFSKLDLQLSTSKRTGFLRSDRDLNLSFRRWMLIKMMEGIVRATLLLLLLFLGLQITSLSFRVWSFPFLRSASRLQASTLSQISITISFFFGFWKSRKWESNRSLFFVLKSKQDWSSLLGRNVGVC